MGEEKLVLTVVFLNTFDCETSVIHLGSPQPFVRRSVQIELTPEQVKELQPRVLGKDRGADRYEKRVECWLEP